ncbi:MAG TPA: hypothetical protein VIH90_06430 [Candidatus Saccharimonadales bacterium]
MVSKEVETGSAIPLTPEQLAVLSRVTAVLISSGIVAKYIVSQKNSVQHYLEGIGGTDPDEFDLFSADGLDDTITAELPFGLYYSSDHLAGESERADPDRFSNDDLKYLETLRDYAKEGVLMESVRGRKTLGMLIVDPRTGFNFEHVSDTGSKPSHPSAFDGYSSMELAHVEEDGTIKPVSDFTDLEPKVFDELLKLVDAQKAVGLCFFEDDIYV